MRPVTVKHWEKMPLRTKSWLLVKAFGFETWVFWHVSLDGSHDKIIGGSFEDESECRRHCDGWIKNKHIPKTAKVRRDFGFWGCAEHLNPGWSVVKAVLNEGYTVHFDADREGVYCIIDKGGERDGKTSHVGWGKTLAESVCSAALKMKGLLIQ